MPNKNPIPVYLQSGDPARELRKQDSYSGGELGQIFTVEDKADSLRPKGYQLVITDSVMDVLPSDGAVAFWLDRTRYRVTTDVSLAGRGNPAGVFRRAATAAEIALTNDQGLIGAVMCLQREGYHGAVQLTSSTTAAPSTAGLPVIPTATDAKADVLAAGTAPTYPQLGVTAGAEGTGDLADTCPVMLDVADQP
jgi:hypothetical protein